MDDTLKILHYLAERSQDVFWIRSADYSKQLYMSPVYERIWGRACAEIYQSPRNWLNYIQPEDRSKIEESIKKRNKKTSQDAVFQESFRIVRPNGEIRWIKDTSFPIHENDQLIAFAGIAQDVTADKERENELIKAKENAEIANQAKTEFLENMRHDIRTPLAGIIGFSEIIQLETKNPKIKEHADLLINSGKSLLKLLNEILDSIKISTGEIPILKIKFNLKAKLSEVIELMTPAILQKKLSIKLHFSDDMPNYFVSDPKRVSRILVELIGNALKYTNEGSINVRVSLAKKNEHIHIVSLEVQDTGIGIPKDKQENIFLRFNRLAPSYKGTYKGSGLGLSNVKAFVDDLDGEIYCQSKVGEGTCFTCLIPMQEALLDDASYAAENDENITN